MLLTDSIHFCDLACQPPSTTDFTDLLLRMNLEPYMSKSCEEVLSLVEDIPRLANAL